MPNPSEAVAVVDLEPKDQLASAYEHGDTDLSPEEDAFPLQTKTEAKTEEKPRNADGTFAKAIEPITATPSKPQHSSRIVQMAKDFGIPDDEIAESTPEQLDFAVYQAHRMQQRWNEERANERALLESARRQPKQEAPQEPLDPADELLAGFEKEFEPESNTAKLIKHLVTENKKLKKEVSTVHDRDRARSGQSVSDAIDDAITALGADYETVFGKGTLADLEKGSDEYLSRISAYNAAGITEQDSPRAAARKYTAASQRLYGRLLKAKKPEADNDYEEAAKEDTNGHTNGKQKKAVEAYNASATHTPTSRKAGEQPGRDKAIRGVSQRLKDIPASEYDADDEGY